MLLWPQLAAPSLRSVAAILHRSGEIVSEKTQPARPGQMSQKVDPVTQHTGDPPGGLVAVRFVKPWRNYRLNEIAGFNPDISAALIEKQFAEAYIQ